MVGVVSDKASSVVPFPVIGRRKAAGRVRELAQETSNLSWTEHACQRMEEREITTRQVLSTLRLGQADGDPTADQDGGWKIVMAKRSAGQFVRVVVALDDDQIFIVTVM